MAVGGFADDLDDLLVLKKILDAFTEKRLVVGDQHLHSFFGAAFEAISILLVFSASLAENYERFSRKVKPKSLKPSPVGTVNKNAAPLPSPSLSTQMRPPWLTTISREIERPRPRRPPPEARSP